jgi:hypothetical protein
MAYLGKIHHERSFKVGRYVVRLTPDEILGIRFHGSRQGLQFLNLRDLIIDEPNAGNGQFNLPPNGTPP